MVDQRLRELPRVAEGPVVVAASVHLDDGGARGRRSDHEKGVGVLAPPQVGDDAVLGQMQPEPAVAEAVLLEEGHLVPARVADGGGHQGPAGLPRQVVLQPRGRLRSGLQLTLSAEDSQDAAAARGIFPSRWRNAGDGEQVSVVPPGYPDSPVVPGRGQALPARRRAEGVGALPGGGLAQAPVELGLLLAPADVDQLPAPEPVRVQGHLSQRVELAVHQHHPPRARHQHQGLPVRAAGHGLQAVRHAPNLLEEEGLRRGRLHPGHAAGGEGGGGAPVTKVHHPEAPPEPLRDLPQGDPLRRPIPSFGLSEPGDLPAPEQQCPSVLSHVTGHRALEVEVDLALPVRPDHQAPHVGGGRDEEVHGQHRPEAHVPGQVFLLIFFFSISSRNQKNFVLQPHKT